MNWITEAQVAEAANKGVIPALECSWKHHNQGATCTRGEMIDVLEEDGRGIFGNWCACCHFHGYTDESSADCSKCLLQADGKCSFDDRCCDGRWVILRDAEFKFREISDITNFQVLQAAESKVCDYITAVLDKERAKECECSKESKRNSEDLDEFSIKCDGGNKLRAEIMGERIKFEVEASCGFSLATATIDEATEIHQKLGQLLATARRAEAKKK